MAGKPVTTRYYRWEGDACRIHTDADGNETADTYRADGYCSLSPTDVQWNGVQIGLAEYQELVDEEDALHKLIKSSSSKPKLILLDGGRSRR
jgi:hypothetical protein